MSVRSTDDSMIFCQSRVCSIISFHTTTLEGFRNHIEEEKIDFMLRDRGIRFKWEVHVGFKGCIPETVTQDGEKLTFGLVDFVCIGANLIVSTEHLPRTPS